MIDISKPAQRPANPRFSSGPCAKYPSFNLQQLESAPLGRSHRAAVGKDKLKAAIEETRELLGVPMDYHIGIVPASDTGAVEMAMWSLLGARPVTMVAWESFGAGWVTDVVKQLKLDATVQTAEYGEIVDMAALDYDTDVVFTWNGTTAGVRMPSGDAIPANRAGLTICDATSAAFAQDLPWDKLDVTTFSWQKVLWRSRPRHADPQPAGCRTAGKLYACLADAQDFPSYQRRQAYRRHFPWRDN